MAHELSIVEEQFPPLRMQPIALDAVPMEPEAEFRRVEATPPPLADRVRFGGPEVTAISTTYHPENADLQAFIASSADRWVLVHMAIDFPPSEGQPLESARVQVNLSDNGSPQSTKAFSLLPQQLTTAREQTNSFTLDPNVTVGPVGISLGSVGRSQTDHSAAPFLIGEGELRADPGWLFTRTAAQQLVGEWRLSLIIHTPKRRTARISVDLEAAIAQRKGWRFQKQRIPLPVGDPAGAHFEIKF